MSDEALETLRRIERKLDALLAALAEEQDEPVTSLDDGKAFPTRDDRRGLG